MFHQENQEFAAQFQHQVEQNSQTTIRRREVENDELKNDERAIAYRLGHDSCDEELAIGGDWFYMDDVKDDLLYGKSYDGGIHVIR